MQLIKDKQICQDEWEFISDDMPLKADYNIVSLTRWQQHHDELTNNQNLGLRLEPSIAVEEIPEDLSAFKLIELYFPIFGDGRLFTFARLLRSRYGFNGDIRASGDFMRDQVYYLHRVGVSSFVLNDNENLPAVMRSFDDFSVYYQESVA